MSYFSRIISLSVFLLIQVLLFHNASGQNLLSVKKINQTLESSAKTLSVQTNFVMKTLESKMNNPATKYKAAIWQPKAVRICEANDSLISLINDIQRLLFVVDENENIDIVQQVMEKNGSAKMLFDCMTKMNEQFYKIDPRLSEIFDTILFTNLKARTGFNVREFQEANFNGATNLETLMLLNGIKNDYQVATLQVTQYCNNQVDDPSWNFDRFGIVISQNTTVSLPGETITFTAGVGAFSAAANPSIYFNNLQIKMNDNGTANYHLTAGKPGKYSIPLTIKYTDENGTLQTTQTTVEYRVVNPAAVK